MIDVVLTIHVTVWVGLESVTMPPIRLLLSDVDGTLINSRKELTAATVEAVAKLRAHGVLFAITSGRPPRGMRQLVDALAPDVPVGAFNGGMLVDRTLNALVTHTIEADLVVPICKMMNEFGLDAWLYRGADWYVPDLEGAHVAREIATVNFEPRLLSSVAGGLSALKDGVAKIVGVTDDSGAMAAANRAVYDTFCDDVTAATSQPYYLDVTHPNANKGAVAQYVGKHYELDPAEIATIGDMPNDVLMFAHSGLSIAMGNADPQVKRAARRITASNDEDGFAKAVDELILPHANGAFAAAGL